MDVDVIDIPEVSGKKIKRFWVEHVGGGFLSRGEVIVHIDTEDGLKGKFKIS